MLSTRLMSNSRQQNYKGEILMVKGKAKKALGAVAIVGALLASGDLQLMQQLNQGI